jgi:hypothetical protein
MLSWPTPEQRTLQQPFLATAGRLQTKRLVRYITPETMATTVFRNRRVWCTGDYWPAGADDMLGVRGLTP